MSHPIHTAKDILQTKMMEKPPNDPTPKEPDIILSKSTNQQPQNNQKVFVRKISIKDLPKLRITGITKVEKPQSIHTFVDSNSNTVPLADKNLLKQNQQVIQRINTANPDQQDSLKSIEALTQSNESTTLKNVEAATPNVYKTLIPINKKAKQIVDPPPTVCVPLPNLSIQPELNQPAIQENQTNNLNNLLISKNNVAATQKKYKAATPDNVGSELLKRDLALTPQNVGATTSKYNEALPRKNNTLQNLTTLTKLNQPDVREANSASLNKLKPLKMKNVGAATSKIGGASTPQNLRAATTKRDWTSVLEKVRIATSKNDYAPTPKNVRAEISKCDVATTQNNIMALISNDYGLMNAVPQNVPSKVFSTFVKAKEPLEFCLKEQNPEKKNMPLIDFADISVAVQPSTSKVDNQALSEKKLQVFQKRKAPAIMKSRARLKRQDDDLFKILQLDPNMAKPDIKVMRPKPTIIRSDPKAIMPGLTLIKPNPKIIWADPSTIKPDPKISRPDPKTIIPAPKTMPSPNSIRPDLKTQIDILTSEKEQKPPNIETTGMKKIRKRFGNEKKVTNEKQDTSRRRASNQTTNTRNMHIAEGLRQDCETLIEKCLQVYKLDFEKFSEIWKTMNFHRIYEGCHSGAELAELSEEVLQVGKYHLVAKGVTSEENVAGLFLVYAFLHFQPYQGFAALRLTPGDVPSIKDLETMARRQRRQDVLYILGKVLIQGPCQFHVLPREVALELPIRKYYDGSVHVPGRDGEGYFTKGCESVRLLNKMHETDQRYAAIKQKLINGPDYEKNLTVSKQPTTELLKMFRRWISPAVSPLDSNTLDTLKQPSSEMERHQMVKSIKEKAMGNLVDPMKHLTGVNERQQLNSSTSSSDTTVEEVKAVTPSVPYKTKGKGKGKGRISAKTLHDLFEGTPEHKLEERNINSSDKQQERLTSRKVTDNPIDITDDRLVPPLSCHVKYYNSKVDGQDCWENEDFTNVDDEPHSKRRKLDNTGAIEETQAVKPVEAARSKRKQNLQSLPDLNNLDDCSNTSLGRILHNDQTIEAQLDKTNEGHKTIIDLIDNINALSERGNNSVLDTIPIELKNVNENIEIEVIDYFKDAKDTEPSKVNADKVDGNGSDSKGDTVVRFETDQTNLMRTVEKIENRMKRKEKGRMRIKSKFKKLGILRMANFEGKEAESSDGEQD